MAKNSLSPIAGHNPRFKVILNNLQNTFNIFPHAHIKIKSLPEFLRIFQGLYDL